MAFYEGLGKRIQQTGQGAIDRTRKTAEVSRLNSSISSLEKEMRDDYEELGRAYYEKYAASGTDDPDMIPYFQDLDGKMEQLEVYKEQIRNLKGIRKCVNCGMEISADATFCNYCGTRQPPVAAPTSNVRRVCPNCGAQLEDGQIFCTVCGTNVENVAADQVSEGPAPRHCVQCGQILEEDVLFCPYCGQRNEIQNIIFEEEPPANGAGSGFNGEAEAEFGPEFAVDPEPAFATESVSEAAEELESEVDTELEEAFAAESEPGSDPVFEPEAVVSARAVCSKCGAELEEDAIFCTNCGQKIER